MSIQEIQPNPQNTSNFYLANIQNALTDPNSNLTFPSSPPPFSPPTYGIWVNALWFLSLVINLTCAILASLLQQWARTYLEVTQTHHSLHKQARTRTFFAKGIERFRVPWVFEALPAMLHLSVFLFFAGLVVFLWNVNLTIFKLATSWVGICTALYGCITFVPLFSHDSPYRTPLTPLARSVAPWILHVFAVVLYASFRVLSTYFGFYSNPIQLPSILLYPLQLLIKVRKMVSLTPEDAALELSSEIDTQAFMRTFDSLDEDKDLDHFFTALPGFYNSKVVKEPLQNLDYQKKRKLLDAIIRLLDRTYSSSPSAKDINHRVDICTNAINQVVAPESFQDILLSLASKDGSGPVQSADVLDFVRRWGTHMDVYDTPLIKAIFSIVVAIVPRHDGSWFDLASSEMGESKEVLNQYNADRNSLSLAILIHITRQHFTHIREQSWPSQAISDILREASTFNVEDTSPELQHKFCALWNEVVNAAPQSDRNSQKIMQLILRPIHEVFVKLHPTDDPRTAYAPRRGLSAHPGETLRNQSQYPSCNISDHLSEATLAIPVDSAPPPLSVSASLHVVTSHPSDQPTPPSSHNPFRNLTSVMAAAAPNALPDPTPAADLGSAIEHDGTPWPCIPIEMNTPPINRSIHADTSVTTPDSRPPSLPSTTDSDGAVTGRSPQEPSAGNTGGDRLPHGRYDIV